MAEKQASYIQASSHPADTDRLVLEGLMNPAGAPVSGAAYGVGQAAGDLLVVQNGTPNMSVNVAAGHVWIDGTESATQGAYHGYNDATKNLVVAASDPTNARKDLVVAKVQDAAYSGATNAWTLAVVTGTPAASPVEPAVPANAVVLAMISVAALATTVTNANITDRRRRACGLSGIAVCLSTTRPAAPYTGQVIYETDTTKELIYDGAAWVEMGTGGAWTSYTPTLTQGVTVTKTVTYARYHRAGRKVTVEGLLTCTGGGTAGAVVFVGLPFAAAQAGLMNIGIGVIFDSSTSIRYGGAALADTTTTIGLLPMSADSTNYLGAAVFTVALAAGDTVGFSVVYEAAS